MDKRIEGHGIIFSWRFLSGRLSGRLAWISLARWTRWNEWIPFPNKVDDEGKIYDQQAATHGG